jgi:hypothetical protein
LALLQLRLVLVLVARESALAPAYAELDTRKRGRTTAAATATTLGAACPAAAKPHTSCGERACMVGVGTAQPVDGMPCRVALNRAYAGAEHAA